MEIVDSSVLPAELFFIPFIFSLPLSLPSSVRSYGHWIAASGRDDNTEPAGGSRGSFFFLSLSLDWRGGGKFSLLLLPTKDTFDELPANGCVNARVCVGVYVEGIARRRFLAAGGESNFFFNWPTRRVLHHRGARV